MLQFVVSGVAIGAVYGLIGMALAITFYVTRIINFAQGQMMMATVMITAEVCAAGYPTWAALSSRTRMTVPSDSAMPSGSRTLAAPTSWNT